MCKSFWISKKHCGLLATAFLIECAAADTPVFSSYVANTDPPSRSFTGTRGWAFVNTGNDSIVITALGVFDEGGDGLANSHEVGVWTYFGDRLLAAASVPAGTEAALLDGYRYVPLPPLIIPPHMLGVIGAAYSAGDADDKVQPLPSGYNGPIHFTGGTIGRWASGSGLPFPANLAAIPCEGCGSENWYEPNFKFEIIPEPHVSAFLGLGLVAWVLVRRKNGNREGSFAES